MRPENDIAYWLAFSYADIRINRYWKIRSIRKKFYTYPDNWNRIKSEIRFRITHGIWHYEYVKNLHKDRLQEYARWQNQNTQQIFTQNCSCGAIFQSADCEVVISTWKKHLEKEHPFLTKP